MLSVSDLTTILFFLLSPHLELFATYIIQHVMYNEHCLKYFHALAKASYTLPTPQVGYLMCYSSLERFCSCWVSNEPVWLEQWYAVIFLQLQNEF